MGQSDKIYYGRRKRRWKKVKQSLKEEKNNPIWRQDKVSKLISMSKMPARGSDTATNPILSQFQSFRAVLVFPTVTGAMFVCGDMAP